MRSILDHSPLEGEGDIAMRIIPDAQEEWEFWTALYPLFKQALPQVHRLNDLDQKDLDIKNAVVTIRSSMFKLGDHLHQDRLKHQLKQDLEEFAFHRFLDVLRSILSLFESLVTEDVMRQQPGSSPSPFPKLAVLKSHLQTQEFSTDLLLEQARYIRFHGTNTQDYCAIAKELQSHVSIVADVFNPSLGALDDIRDNAALLRDDEIEFVKRAHGMNNLSNSLFNHLANSLTCSKAHTAMMHLSGFLDTEFKLELLITGCAEPSWHFTNCRWMTPPLNRTISSHIFCSQRELLKSSSSNFHLAFDHEGMWLDTAPEKSVGTMSVPASAPSLWELLARGSSDSPIHEVENFGFDPEDRKIVELLLACSLLHLNTSHWLQLGWDTDNILLYPMEANAQNPLKRWRPFISCSLDSSSSATDEPEDIRDVVSFGLLIMEMEAELKVSPTDALKDWDTGLISTDSMLNWALTDSKWKGKVEDGYKRIAKACLDFRERVDKFYDPDLPKDMKRTAALYRYIIAPLHELITQRFSSASLCSQGFPDPSKSASSLYGRGLSHSCGSGLVLFDDFGSSSAWHNPDTVLWASKFMKNIDPFVEKIRDLEYKCKPIPAWPSCRRERIRIAIIDTGIDDEDIHVEIARDVGRIKDCNCRGFVKDADDYQDRHGHGTRVARLILQLAPSAELYIAKISNDKSIESKHLNRISEAIKWACEKNVHIISMSFGLENRDRDIDKAISIAFKHGITMFAAAANNGGNRPRAYPSNKYSSVICVHASDGLGNPGAISPSPVAKEDNFSTLGISVPSRWKKVPVTISGTSFATPIAVAMAADVLEFARYKCFLDEYEQQCLYHFNGIRKILRLISEERQGYDYIMPRLLWKSERCDNENEDEDIARKITDIARS